MTIFSEDTSRHFSRKKKRIALVAQGGGQRGIFTAGVLDSFLAADFDPFELYIGTSAGALNLSSFIARREGFAHNFITRFTTQKRFFNLFKYVRSRESMDLDWAFQASGVSDPEILGLKKAQFVLKNRHAYACATNAKTLEPHFFRLFEDNWVQVLKASCAIPLLYPSTVKMGNQNFVDGAVSAPIPVREAFNRGADIIVVLRTEPTVLKDQMHIIPTRIDNFRLQIEKQFPTYLTRLNMDDRLDKLHAFQQKLSKQIQYIHARYKDNSLDPFWYRIKNAVPERLNRKGGRWRSDGHPIYRLQLLSGYNFNLDMIDMLTKHHHNYQNAMDFMLHPPARIKLLQISPSEFLSSNALLSKPQDLERDYQNGVKVGNLFLSRYAEMLNEISTV